MAKRINELENHLRQWEAKNRKRTALVTLAPVRPLSVCHGTRMIG
ncbi:MAG: hypothetical protein R3C97_18190 [Geminicoccaceae bacterium]